MRISDWSSAVCSSDLHRPEHLPRDDLRETRNRVERAAQFVDQLADRIARIFGRGPAIGRFIALRTQRARAIAAKLAGRRIEPGQRRKAPFTGFGGRRTEEAHVGKERVSTFWSRWSASQK